MPFLRHHITLSLYALLAAPLWLLGSTLVICDYTDATPHGSGLIGVVFVAGGHLLCMCALSQRVITQVEREREVFQLGRDYERGVRSL